MAINDRQLTESNSHIDKILQLLEMQQKTYISIVNRISNLSGPDLMKFIKKQQSTQRIIYEEVKNEMKILGLDRLQITLTMLVSQIFSN